MQQQTFIQYNYKDETKKEKPTFNILLIHLNGKKPPVLNSVEFAPLFISGPPPGKLIQTSLQPFRWILCGQWEEASGIRMSRKYTPLFQRLRAHHLSQFHAIASWANVSPTKQKLKKPHCWYQIKDIFPFPA